MHILRQWKEHMVPLLSLSTYPVCCSDEGYASLLAHVNMSVIYGKCVLKYKFTHY